ncbi:tRNA pseudouridine synthase B [Desulfosporosinus acidiphilus SJ4]|uniref:tRNA pseudouridine synthase B n=1 Tax=Desulfosporosinus acidiphilus (strain DSM 22704 / JCM 16185 / SJ4) TaxID=646529 RepID=I4D9E8_DESAJ|nr:tRNA pseudouridine(55) synthase TruB [Desulfosporosinus acidiphilus]AFM42422.1 tRNA pseudouridine synthase B [Desulfosporosinus acidiphilus SJ4]
MDGLINVLKPPGMTSADVVGWLRKTLKTKKIGHTGTLDPGVVGVLPICVGKGTRLAEYITGQGKTYLAEVTFGIATDTQDSFGQRIFEQKPQLQRTEVEEALRKFAGNVSQIPPMYSAVRKEGRHLYEYARQGFSVEREAREVTISKIELKKWYDEEFPRALLHIECSKGTYIRTLCHDLGEALGCGAYMSFLLRVRSGPFEILSSWTLEEIEEVVQKDSFPFLLPLTTGIDLPKVYLTTARAKAFRNGLSTKRELVRTSSPVSDSQVQVLEGDMLIGIGMWRENSLVPYKVIG